MAFRTLFHDTSRGRETAIGRSGRSSSRCCEVSLTSTVNHDFIRPSSLTADVQPELSDWSTMAANYLCLSMGLCQLVDVGGTTDARAGDSQNHSRITFPRFAPPPRRRAPTSASHIPLFAPVVPSALARGLGFASGRLHLGHRELRARGQRVGILPVPRHAARDMSSPHSSTDAAGRSRPPMLVDIDRGALARSSRGAPANHRTDRREVSADPPRTPTPPAPPVPPPLRPSPPPFVRQARSPI